MASDNPLFDQPGKTGSKKDKKESGYVLPPNTKKIEPSKKAAKNSAADVVRDKLAAIYAEEPSAKKELAGLADAPKPLSKHQKALSDIQTKAESVAEIQTKWHEYYLGLPEAEKHEVWREFYAEQAQHSRYANFMMHSTQGSPDKPHDDGKAVVSKHEPATPSATSKRLRDARSSRDVKDALKRKVATNQHRETKSPLSSVFFGLGVGGFVLLVMLFGLFNELVVAPFIQPSRNVSATPIILDNNSMAADGKTKIVIPKINVEIPVDYSVNSMEEDAIQQGLETGVVHYPTTVRPGQQGNAAFFGHSSNNIFNPGKYKFAFVLLKNLENGDMFYLTYNKQVYAYKVFKKQVVSPDDVWILNPVAGKTATAALITCDPPGTTLNRLVVWGEQVSPDPASNSEKADSEPLEAEELTGAPPSLWRRLIGL